MKEDCGKVASTAWSMGINTVAVTGLRGRGQCGVGVQGQQYLISGDYGQEWEDCAGHTRSVFGP